MPGSRVLLEEAFVLGGVLRRVGRLLGKFPFQDYGTAILFKCDTLFRSLTWCVTKISHWSSAVPFGKYFPEMDLRVLLQALDLSRCSCYKWPLVLWGPVTARRAESSGIPSFFSGAGEGLRLLVLW